MKTTVDRSGARMSQCQKPTGWLGRLTLWNMNSRHSKVTDWGLRRVSIAANDTILDVGCGGGRTLSKLAALAKQGKVYGIDHSQESVAASKRANAGLIREGRVEVHQGSVSHVPFQEGMFDLVTAIESHFWWPNLSKDMREIFRVVKTGGKLIVIAEVYKGANTAVSKLAEKYASKAGMKMLDIDEHRGLFVQAGFSEVEVATEADKGWICATGRKA